MKTEQEKISLIKEMLNTLYYIQELENSDFANYGVMVRHIQRKAKETLELIERETEC